MATVGKTSLRTAIVFGANGVSGTAAITQMLKGDAFDKIIAVSRRPGQIETDNPRVIWVTLDVLASNAADLAKALVDFGGEEATHAFHFAYIEKQSPEEQTKVNVELLRKALDATNNACPDLKTFLLQTGMKVYKISLSFETPLILRFSTMHVTKVRQTCRPSRSEKTNQGQTRDPTFIIRRKTWCKTMSRSVAAAGS